MAWLNLTDMKTLITTKIKSLGIGGLTRAADVRDVLNDMADTIHGGSGSSFEVDDSLEANPLLRLVGDEQTPTDGKFYGKIGGAKGWYVPPPDDHTHVIADVTNLQTELNGKAASSHTHAIADVTGLQTALDGKLSSPPTAADSVEYSSSAYRLANDTATPNKSHAYSTNAAGTRGFNSLANVWFGVQVFTGTPPSTSQITFTDALVKVGFGLRYKIGGTWFYGIITAYSAGTATIVGESASGTITELEFCGADNIERLPYDLSEKTLTVASSTALTAQTTNGNYKPTTWYDAPAKLVAAYVRAREKGAGTNPVVNLRISAFGSDAFGSNITIAADETTYGTAVTSTPANNVLAFSNTIQLRVITENTLAKHTNLYLLIIKNI